MTEFIQNLFKGSGTVMVVWAYLACILIEGVTKYPVPNEIKEGLLGMALLTIRRGIGNPIQEPKGLGNA